MSYVYIKSEPGLWTAGFYDPAGKWIPEGDFTSPEEARIRVAWLNGGNLSSRVETLERAVYVLQNQDAPR